MLFRSGDYCSRRRVIRSGNSFVLTNIKGGLISKNYRDSDPSLGGAYKPENLEGSLIVPGPAMT